MCWRCCCSCTFSCSHCRTSCQASTASHPTLYPPPALLQAVDLQARVKAAEEAARTAQQQAQELQLRLSAVEGGQGQLQLHAEFQKSECQRMQQAILGPLFFLSRPVRDDANHPPHTHSCILMHTHAYSCILMHTHAYSCHPCFLPCLAFPCAPGDGGCVIGAREDEGAAGVRRARGC